MDGLENFIDGLKKIEKGEGYKLYDKPNKKSPMSVFFVNFTDWFADNYPAKFNEELARMLIKDYTNEGETVLDPMAGSGVIPLIALELNRNGLYQDINPEAYDLFYAKSMILHERYSKWGTCAIGHVGDSTKKIENVPDDSVDLILTSPPFGLSIDAAHDKYSDNPDDLGNSEDYEEWRKKMKLIIKNCFQVLKPGGLAIFETRPRSKKGHSYPLNMWIWQDATEIGFEYFTERIEVVIPLAIWTFGDKEQRKPMPMHSYLTIMRKPENSKL